MSKRNPKTLGVWGPNGTRVVASEAMWKEPLKWNRNAKPVSDSLCLLPEGWHRPRVFCASLADVFEDWQGPMLDANARQLWHFAGGYDEAHELGIQHNGDWRPTTMDDVRARLFRLIDATPNLDWLLLTKRPENIAKMTPIITGRFDAIKDAKANREAWTRLNVWLGVSVEDQKRADERIQLLLQTPATVRFLSCEPLLGPIDLRAVRYLSGNALFVGDEGGWEYAGSKRQMLSWCIIGGESGPGARPCSVEWIRDIVRQCKAASVPVFVKQLGSQPVLLDQMMMDQAEAEVSNENADPADIAAMAHAAANSPLRLFDKKGGDPAEWPADLRVREFPSPKPERTPA